jgi:hypothetical protein
MICVRDDAAAERSYAACPKLRARKSCMLIMCFPETRPLDRDRDCAHPQDCHVSVRRAVTGFTLYIILFRNDRFNQI